MDFTDDEMWAAEKKDFETFTKNHYYKFLKDEFVLLKGVKRTPKNNRVFEYKCRCGCVRRLSHGWCFQMLVKHTDTIKHKKLIKNINKKIKIIK